MNVRSFRVPITKRWPAQHPDRLQLYSLPTPNGVKVSIMLEEIGLAYEPHTIDIGKNETFTPEFLSLNPNGKIPAIMIRTGPVARRSGCLSPVRSCNISPRRSRKASLRRSGAADRPHSVGAVPDVGDRADVGQVGFFHKFAGREFEDKRPLQRYVNESKRLLGVLDARCDGRTWMMGDDYSIADIASLGWVRNLNGSRRRRTCRVRQLYARHGVAGARPGTTGGAARAGDSEKAVRG